MRKLKAVKHITLEDLEFCDGVYNVGHLVTLDHPWVSRDKAEEILEIVNSHIDWVVDELSEAKDE
jgi:hypothetical protein